MNKCKLCDNTFNSKKVYCQSCNRLRSLAFRQNTRAHKLGIEGIIDADEWVRLCQQSHHQCLRCGTQGNLSIDHAISFISGGTNTLDNIQPLCLPCNFAKRYDFDYRNEDPIIREKRWKYIAESSKRQYGRQGKMSITYCLSGAFFDAMCLHLLDQGIDPTKQNIQRFTREWIYEAIEKRLNF